MGCYCLLTFIKYLLCAKPGPRSWTLMNSFNFCKSPVRSRGLPYAADEGNGKKVNSLTQRWGADKLGCPRLCDSGHTSVKGSHSCNGLAARTQHVFQPLLGFPARSPCVSHNPRRLCDTQLVNDRSSVAMEQCFLKEIRCNFNFPGSHA